MDGNGAGRNPRSLTLRKHRREPASDPATARSARNRKSKITCGEHSSSDSAWRQIGRIEDSGG